jgi:phosphoinositide-3-kinase, regulatory subunit 4
MGNQLAISGAAASIQLSDVSSSMTLMAPLGVGRRGRLFTSMHCGALSPDWDPNTATASSQQQQAALSLSAQQGAGGGGGGQHPQRRRIRQEFVIKVFLRNADDKLQAQLITQHHEMLISIEKRLRVPPPVPPPVPPLCGTTSSVTDSNASPPIHLLFYNEMDRRNERFCKLQRPFVQHSITERLQMRPQCTQDQRLFFAFQLLEALDQLHTHYGLVHGDLKVENVLVTSHNWLHLVDFAPFKPPMLPSYNPANFEFYYDASETRVCCAAPEKFFDFATAVVKSSTETSVSAQPTASPTSSLPPPAASAKSGAHTSSMDVFSAACVIAQIMTDEPLFRLSGVLELRSKASYAEKEAYIRRLLQEKGVVSEALLRFLVAPLCSAPEKRPTAREMLNDTSVFPQYFGFLHDRVFPNVLRAPPDVQVLMVHSQWERMMRTVEDLSTHPQFLTPIAAVHQDPSLGVLGPADSLSHLPPGESYLLQRQVSDEALLQRGEQRSMSSMRQQRRARRTSVTLLLPVVVSSIRHLKSIEARSQVIDVLRLCIASDATPTSIRDIMVPHLVHLIRRPVYPLTASVTATSDSTSAGTAGGSAVRAHAIHVLRIALDERTAQQLFQSSEALLFDDYIFPVLSEAARDTSVLVQCALAAHVPHLLSTATKFLEWRQTFYCGTATTTTSLAGASCLTYDAQLHAIHVYGWDLLKSLYKQRHPAVTIAILRETCPAVVDFLGEERTQDDLLPLLTTMVSSSLEVRREAILCALRLQALLDAPRPKMLRFFAEEGLRQTDSGCLLGTIAALQHLVETQCKMEPVELLNVVLAVIPQMANPSHWVRVAACHLVEACARTYRPADIMLHLECAVRPFLNHAVPLSMLSQFPNAVKSELSWVHTDHSIPLSATGASAAAQQQHDYDGSQIAIPAGVTTHTTVDLMVDDHHVDVPHSKSAAAAPTLLRASTTSAAEPAVAGGTLEGEDGVSAVDALNNSDTRVNLPGDALSSLLGDEPPLDWSLAFAPSARHARRYSHQSEWERSCGSALQQALVQRRAATQGGAGGSAGGVTANNNSTQAHRARSSTSGSRPTNGSNPSATSSAAAVPSSSVQSMRPTAAPIFTSAADAGGSILAMDSIGGLMVSAGSRGCVKIWEISADDYLPSSNVVPSLLHLVPDSETTLAASFLCASAAATAGAGLLLGGTQGIVRYCEVEADRVISQAPIGRTQSAAGGRVVSSVAKLMHHSLALVSSGDGVVAVLDVRTKELLVWQSVVDASRGPLVATLAIGPTDAMGVATAFQHAAVAATNRGHVMLFDLRHRIEVAHHTIRRQSSSSASTGFLATTSDASAAQSPVQILSIANDVLPPTNSTTSVASGGGGALSQPHRNLAFGSHSIFVGTRGAGLLKLDLTTGNIIQTFTTAMPTDIRTILPAPRSPWVVTGSADRLIRVWNATSPSSSYTLCSTASESPKVIVSSGVAEEGVAPANGFGPWRADASSSMVQSQYRQHHCDQVTVVHALRLRTAHYLVSGSRNGQLTVWHNAGQ